MCGRLSPESTSSAAGPPTMAATRSRALRIGTPGAWPITRSSEFGSPCRGDDVMRFEMSGRRTAPNALLKNGRLLVRRLLDEDAHLLLEWLSNPTLFQFYGGRDQVLGPLAIRDQYLTKQGAPVTGCILEWEGRPIGYIQFYPLYA